MRLRLVGRKKAEKDRQRTEVLFSARSECEVSAALHSPRPHPAVSLSGKSYDHISHHFGLPFDNRLRIASYHPLHFGNHLSHLSQSPVTRLLQHNSASHSFSQPHKLLTKAIHKSDSQNRWSCPVRSHFRVPLGATNMHAQDEPVENKKRSSQQEDFS